VEPVDRPEQGNPRITMVELSRANVIWVVESHLYHVIRKLRPETPSGTEFTNGLMRQQLLEGRGFLSFALFNRELVAYKQ
jgi:hypothetical protein